MLPIGRGDVKRGGFVCSVSGKRRGKGSSREQSPYAEMCAGIQVAIAENIERIYKQNCQNLGLLTSTDFSLIDADSRTGKKSHSGNLPRGEDEITRQMIEYGGLFPLNVARMQAALERRVHHGERKREHAAAPCFAPIAARPRPMTLAEKIFARHMVGRTTVKSEWRPWRRATTGFARADCASAMSM